MPSYSRALACVALALALGACSQSAPRKPAAAPKPVAPKAAVVAPQPDPDAVVQSAFPLDNAALAEVGGALEKRFGRKLNLSVQLDESLIGGIRVVVGDEVLDTSVKARLEQMKVALTA